MHALTSTLVIVRVRTFDEARRADDGEPRS